MKIGITGTSSAIGRAVFQTCRESGHEVVDFTRTATMQNQRHFDLASEVTEIDVADLNAMIHLGWDRSLDKQLEFHVSVMTSKKLIDKCHEFKVRLVFLSSTSANVVSKSYYGRSKFQVEEYALERGFKVIRSGFIWGRELSGFSRSLHRIANFPIAGLYLLPDPLIMHTEADSLAQYLLDCVGCEDFVSFRAYFVNGEIKLSKILELMRIKKTRFWFGIHVTFIDWVTQFCQMLKISLPFERDSLRSIEVLATRREFDTFKNFGTAIDVNRFSHWMTKMNSGIKADLK